jgi:hypothetical protein
MTIVGATWQRSGARVPTRVPRPRCQRAGSIPTCGHLHRRAGEGGVAQPGVSGQPLHGVERNGVNRFVQASGKLLHEIAHQQRHIVRQLFHRRVASSSHDAPRAHRLLRIGNGVVHPCQLSAAWRTTLAAPIPNCCGPRCQASAMRAAPAGHLARVLGGTDGSGAERWCAISCPCNTNCTARWA